MEFKINFEYQNGHEDFFIVSGETVDEIRKKADQELANRQGVNPWSEEIKE